MVINGCIPSPISDKDKLLSNYIPAIKRYPEVCLPPFDLDVLNQGFEPSCVGFSCSAMKQYMELRERNYKVFDGSWIYNECKKIDGMPTFPGTYLRSGLTILKTIGAKTGNENPAKYKIKMFAKVDDLSFEGIKKAIFLYGVVLAGFTGSNEGWKGEVVRPPKAGESTWGHACLTPGTKVLTINGHKNIEDIKKGDVVLTHLGNWKPVNNVMKRKFDGLLNRIKFHNQVNSLHITDEHPVYIDKTTKNSKLKQKSKDRIKKFDWVDSSSIEKYNMGLCPIPEFREVQFDNDLAYLLGLYLADGNLKRGTLNPTKFKAIRFSLNREKDIEIEKKLIKIFKEKFNLLPHYYYSKRGKDVQVIFYNSSIARWFCDMAGGPNDKGLPFEFIMGSPISSLKNIIDGWIDGDGYRESKERAGGFTSSEKLAYQIQTILQRCRMSYGVRKEERRETSYGSNGGWTFYISYRPSKTKTHYWDNNEIKRIEKTDKEHYSGYVYNIEVGDDNSYIAEGAAVHNCALTGYEKNYIIGQNSWGEKKHNKGLFKVPSNYLPFEAWTIIIDDINEAIDTGWVAGTYLRNNITTANLNMREGAGVGFKVIRLLPSGTQVQPTGINIRSGNHNWVEILR